MIKVICVGKVKEKYLRDAIEEYSKRLSKYTKLEIIECNDYSGLDINTIMSKEKDEIIKYIQDKDYVITLEINGKMYSSEELSNNIDKILQHNPNITFIIGGSYGLHSDILNRSNESMSFSKLTFPHQLFRVMLLEQIYRSYKILNGETYHK